MPKGPGGEKRPADVIGAAVKVMRIATGEIEDERDATRSCRTITWLHSTPSGTISCATTRR